MGRNINCIAPEENTISNCGRMIKDPKIRYTMWTVLVGILLGNVIALILRVIYEDYNYAQSLLIHNLNIGDFLMGIYLAGVVYRSVVWAGDYYLHDQEWRSSAGCRVFGVISLLSSQVCVFTLAVITYDRRGAVVHGMLHTPMNRCTAWKIVTLIWTVSLVISIIPAVAKGYFYSEEKGGYYGTNGLCLPLQLAGEMDPAWEYCLAIFGVLNFLIACYMFWAYISMFYASYTSARNTKNDRRMKDEPKMIGRYAAIVFTDILCWFPIAILLFTSLAGVVNDIDNDLYTWFSTCVIPINSAINPMIYTITTPIFWPKLKSFFQRIVCDVHCTPQNIQEQQEMDDVAALQSSVAPQSSNMHEIFETVM